MPLFTKETELACPPATVWDFLIRPANVVLVSPPELNLQLADGPPLLTLGARMTLVGQRWGISQRVVSEVTLWEPGVRFRDEQRDGPFKKWMHTHQLTATPNGTMMRDEIDFEPPGGMLGFLVTGSRVLSELEGIFAHRAQRLRELLET